MIGVAMATNNKETEQQPLSQHDSVRLDVGGSLFRVSRSLLGSNTMLARLVSDTWQQDDGNDEPIFIDRDGETFRHVLNYLRHGKVNLPLNVSSEDFYLDLDYYGIDPKQGTVVCGSTAYRAATTFGKMSKGAETKAHDLELKSNSLLLAQECYKRYAQTLGLQISFRAETDATFYRYGSSLVSKPNVLNESLALYGFRCTLKSKYNSGYDRSVDVQLKPIDAENAHDS